MKAYRLLCRAARTNKCHSCSASVEWSLLLRCRDSIRWRPHNLSTCRDGDLPDSLRLRDFHTNKPSRRGGEFERLRTSSNPGNPSHSGNAARNKPQFAPSSVSLVPKDQRKDGPGYVSYHGLRRVDRESSFLWDLTMECHR